MKNELTTYKVKALRGTALGCLKASFNITEKRDSPLLEYVANIDGRKYLIVDYGFDGDDAFMTVKEKKP